MKRAYKKPILAMESFQLDAAVANSCSSQNYEPINLYDYAVCKVDGGYFFNLDHCKVDLTPDDGDGNDTTCYHGPNLTGGLTFIYS